MNQNQETMRQEQRLAIHALQVVREMDELERLRFDWRELTDEQMNEIPHGANRTRQQIIDDLQQARNDIDAAIAWVKQVDQ